MFSQLCPKSVCLVLLFPLFVFILVSFNCNAKFDQRFEVKGKVEEEEEINLVIREIKYKN